MFKYSNFLVATAVFTIAAVASFKTADAAGTDRVDPLLQKAIQQSAAPEPPPSAPEPVIIPPPVEEPLPVIADTNIDTAEPPQRTLGLRAGGLLFLPQILVSETYDDNIYATDNNEDSDFITTINPSIEITIPESRHELSIKGNYEYRKYLDNDDEDQHNIAASAEGFLRATEWLKFPFATFWRNGHENRAADLTVQRPDEPVDTDRLTTKAGLEIKPGRFALGILGHYGKERFEDGFSTINNAQVIRRDADRDWMQGETYISYDLSNNHRVKLSGTMGERNYDRNNYQGGGFNGPKRDSQTWGAMAGWHFAFTDLKGHISAGYADYNYDDATLTDMQEFVADGKITHSFNDITSFNLTFGRDIYEDPEIVNPATKSRVGIYLDHKLRERFLIAAGADYEYLEFEGANRDDEEWKFRALADYFLTDSFALGLEYVHSLRDSSVSGFDYGRNQIMLKARGRI